MIKVHLTTENRCYNTSGTIVPKGLMLHSVGVPQPDPDVFIRSWNSWDCDIGVHGLIGADECYQLLPWNKRGWHAGVANKGGPSANDTHIGIEMTEPSTIKYIGGATFTDLNIFETQRFITKTYNNAVRMFAELCIEFGFNPITDIISHAEGYVMGIASNHGDPTHLWSRYPSLGFTMNGFRKDVKKYMDASVQPSLWAKEACDWCMAQGLFKGDEFGDFHWKTPITREEIAVVLYRMAEGRG